jgi:hypothetical protein
MLLSGGSGQHRNGPPAHTSDRCGPLVQRSLICGILRSILSLSQRRGTVRSPGGRTEPARAPATEGRLTTNAMPPRHSGGGGFPERACIRAPMDGAQEATANWARAEGTTGSPRRGALTRGA